MTNDAIRKGSSAVPEYPTVLQCAHSPRSAVTKVARSDERASFAHATDMTDDDTLELRAKRSECTRSLLQRRTARKCRGWGYI